ncbi:MAG: hypothetical protein QNJ54_17515 [Prochloraceae cyanobacterium]|nr:hypothetical protein [Prochloraceae cyanobacterium]
MTNAKETYEAKILETPIENGERLGLVETEIKLLKQDVQKLDPKVDNEFGRLNSKISWLFGAVFAVGASILAALYAQPILSALSQ